jgi:pimeloyl-ACP methyl ester carboxylesterase
MNGFQFAEIVTSDQIIHQGIYFAPAFVPLSGTGKAKIALLWVHGLTSTFYAHGSLLESFANSAEKEGWGLAAFNNRGHDVILSLKKLDPTQPKGYARVSGGSAYEDFSQSIFDIQAGVDFLKEKGFTKIILIGHSTGANKVCYYAGKKRDPAVVGLVLASAVSDRLDPSLNKKEFAQRLKKMQKFVRQGKGDMLIEDMHMFPATPKRFVSSFQPHSLEDQFDYGDPHPKLAYFAKISVPTLTIWGALDEYLDRPAQEVATVFSHLAHSPHTNIILPNLNHGFGENEKLFVSSVSDWVKKLE